MTSLDDLFKQIIHTERRAQQRKNFIYEIKSNVQQFKDNIKETERECICLRGQLAAKVQQLNEDELANKLLQNKERALSEQHDILTSEKQELKDQVNKVISIKNEETERFCDEVEKFVTSYSLISNGQMVRENEARQKITDLKSKLDHLQQESSKYNEKETLITDLNHKLKQLEDEKAQLETEITDIRSKLQDERKISEEKENLLKSPNKNPEFIRLQEQLDCLKDENLEEKCNELQKEMWRLQQQCWQQQVKEKQKQQDLRRQTLREGKQNLQPVSNRLQVTNFIPATTQEKEDELSNQELQDMFTDEFNHINCQKSLFKNKCSG